ncbi:MAG: ABC transporter ATP-binding protein [Candidatus Bathyarchaeia archaeon]
MEEILNVRALSKSFGGIYAVNNVNFKINNGEVCSIVGPNGAGKTTLINLISGFYPCDSGKIIFAGKDVTKLMEMERIKLGIARSFQIPALFENLSALDNLRAAIFSQTKRTKVLFKNYEEYEDATLEGVKLLEDFGIPKNVKARELPQGQRKLLDVAIAFALKPKLILLDEPTSGVSRYEKQDIIEKILRLKKESKATLLMIEHDFEIAAYAPRTLVMNRGKIVDEGNLNELMEKPEIKSILIGE